MKGLFTAVLNMSITASYVALAVMVFRIILKKVPKIFSYVLWLPLLIRLVFPFSFNSNFSFLRLLKPYVKMGTRTIEYVPNNIGLMQKPTVNIASNGINNAINKVLPPATPISSANPMQIVIEIASIVWIAGIVALLVFSTISYLKVSQNIKTATLVKDNIYETDKIATPFVCGLIKPKIYIPAGIGGNELSYVMAHEQVHVKRLDYIVKPIAFLALILHWFNPLIWLSFALMSKDMEMSCDESVIKEMDNSIKGNYANSLLTLSVKRSGLLLGSPLAFGESDIKSRIKNILSYKKPALGVVVAAIVITTVLMTALAANPKSGQLAGSKYSGYNIETLISNKTPYVGNNSKDIALIDAMQLPKGIVRDTVELQTVEQPYGITINLIMKDSNSVKGNGGISGDHFYRNSIMLFCLIDNVDIVKYRITDQTGKHNGAIYDFTFTRKMVEKQVGQDVRPFGANADTIKKLINIVNKRSFSDIQNRIAEQIEKNIAIIMSSPMQSSNAYDYIEAHKNEYDNIIKMGDEETDYLFRQLEKDNSGLRGQIIRRLCEDILAVKAKAYYFKN